MDILHVHPILPELAPSSQYQGSIVIKSPAILQSRNSVEFELSDDILEQILDTEALEAWAAQHCVKMRSFVLSGSYKIKVKLKDKE